MRLIDADALIEEIRNKIPVYRGRNTFMSFVDDMPTAYDTEKVVAELEEEREYSYADFEEYVNEKSPCLDAEYDDYFHRGLERAIKLVRKGGV